MDTKEKKEAEQEIATLSALLENSPEDVALLEQRADLYYRTGSFGNAINDYKKVLEKKPDRQTVKTKIELIQTILRYTNTDIYASTNTNMDPWLE